MYALGIPKTQYRRITQVLRSERSNPIEYNYEKQSDGFYLFTFPDMDEYGFENIVKILKNNGVTTIGADEQLTERKMKKLIDLIKEQNIDGKNPMGQDAASLGKGSGGRITKVQKLKMSDIQDEVTINQKVGSCSQPNNVDKCLDDVTISWGNESHTVSFEYGGVIDDYGIDRGVDAEFMADSDDGRWQFILDVQGANGIEDGDCNPCIQGYDWDELIIQDHPENEDHLDPEDRFDQDPGYDDDPRFDDAIRSDFDDPRMEEGRGMLQERFQKLAGLKPLYELEGSFDSRMQAAGGFSDEEMGDITSRDIGDGESPFPGTDNVSPFTAKAKDYTEMFKQEYKGMSDDGIDEFNKEIIEYLLNAFPSAQAAAKVFFAKRNL